MNDQTDNFFSAEEAVQYGHFVALAYRMYDNDPTNPKPVPPVPFLGGYEFVAWIQMKDFILGNGDWRFYGFLAQNIAEPGKSILAIRGTRDLTEWWDDITSMIKAPLSGFGNVAYGFDRIYKTLRIISSDPAPVGVGAAAQAPEPAPSFAKQVAMATARHVTTKSREKAVALSSESTVEKSIVVTGHSLGAALATLYVAENASQELLRAPLICTFASPRVGDSGFAAAFDQLDTTSWRVVNELDAVPKLPFIGFEHVKGLQEYNSASSAAWSLSCWHSLDTYLHLLDPAEPLTAACASSHGSAAVVSLRTTITKAVEPAVMAAQPDQTPVVLGTAAKRSVTIRIEVD